jgi:gamma-tubulin complex component 5
LLLKLSDNPIEKTRIEELEKLQRPSTPPPLTWRELLQEDPFEDAEDVWKNIDYGEGSTDEDVSLINESDDEQLLGLKLREIESDSPVFKANIYAERDFDALKEILQAQNQYRVGFSASTASLAEIEVVRETIFMLHGLPTTIYQLQSGRFELCGQCNIEGISSEMLQAVLSSFCAIGSTISLVKEWVSKPETISILQTLQACLAASLNEFQLQLTKIEQHIIDGQKPTKTLLNLAADLEEKSRLIVSFNDLVLAQKKEVTQFNTLETLYKLVCEKQSLGEMELYTSIAHVFFKCFNTYLKPMRLWMEDGRLLEDDSIFFIRRSSKSLQLASLWSDQFYLVCDAQGSILAPQFLQLAANKIFISGKSINLLKSLGRELPTTNRIEEPILNVQSVCKPELDMISPFEDLFSQALDRWIFSKYHLSSSRVLEIFISECKFWTTLDALAYIFLSKNGAIFQNIAYSIFDKIDRGKRWQDRFALIDLFQDRLATIKTLEVGSISIRILDHEHIHQAKARSIRKLEAIEVEYRLPWTVSMVIKPKSLSIYQRIVILLFQLHRANQLLDRQSLAFTLFQKQSKRLHKGYLSVRHHLKWFVITVLGYLTKALLEPEMIGLQSRMKTAKDIDEFIKIFSDSMLDLEVSCLLAESQHSTLEALVSLLDLVVLFHDQSFGELSLLPKVQKQAEDSSSDEELEEQHGTMSSDPDEFDSKLLMLFSTYNRLLTFIVTGVEESSRIHKSFSLQILVDDLRFGLNKI